jgi:hypothetical protein
VDLRGVRDELETTQKEFAALLGVSLRAVQSYEQGWRATPPHVQKMAILLMYLSHRAEAPEEEPCWTARGCSETVRADCPAACLHAGDLCWLVTGEQVDGEGAGSWDAKWARCRRCPVIERFMPPDLRGQR